MNFDIFATYIGPLIAQKCREHIFYFETVCLFKTKKMIPLVQLHLKKLGNWFNRFLLTG